MRTQRSAAACLFAFCICAITVGCKPRAPTPPPAPTNANSNAYTWERLLAKQFDVAVPEPENADDPVAVGAVAMLGSDANGQYIGVVIVQFRVDPPWHAYASVTHGSANMPVEIDAAHEDAVTWVTEWQRPAGEVDPMSGDRTLHDEFEFRRVFSMPQIDIDPAGTAFTCDLSFQVCDPMKCLPPDSRKILAEIEWIEENEGEGEE